MKKKRKLVIGLMIAFGLFVNITGKLDTHDSHSANSTHSFTIFADKGPIGGNHWKVSLFAKKLRANILYVESGIEIINGYSHLNFRMPGSKTIPNSMRT